MTSPFVFTLAAAVCAAPALAAPLSDARIQQLGDAVFGPVMTEHDIPGMAIGITYRGESHVLTRGLAVREGAQPVTADTLFELGSVSKLFNVALAGLAAERGLLSLDAAVSDLRPDLQGSAFDWITLYDLAAHANGGLPLQVPDTITTEAALSDWLAGWTTAAEPQSLRAYSNLSIGLLGRLTAEAFGRDYETALTEDLLPELGLSHTYVTVPDAAMPDYAFGYARPDDSAVRVTPGMLDAEAYGIKSSVTDMLRFLDAHLGAWPVTPEVEAALARTREVRYDTAHYAQAMIWEDYAWPVTAAQLAAGNSSEMALTPQPITRRDTARSGPVFLNKTGATNGFGAYVAMVPQEEIGVVVLANRNYPNAARAEATLDLITRILAED
ncbi:class C beta-lactamase [Salipiger marinus]|uniref:class C beta-lactamase n=1 Tax=Salipiger marinus TaxID=555512 RepID=UPI00405A1AD5